jgi:hypothetical protein
LGIVLILVVFLAPPSVTRAGAEPWHNLKVIYARYN